MCIKTRMKGTIEEISAYSRSLAIKMVKPKDISLDLDTVCNVSELYFDVTKMLRRYQGMLILILCNVYGKEC